MSMTKLKVGIISAVIVAGVTIPIVMHQRAQSELRAVNEALRQQAENASQLAAENGRVAKAETQKTTPSTPATNPSMEVLRLRGEVGRLRQENAAATAAALTKTNGPSMLSGLAANPEMMKMIRTQNKAGLQMAYKRLADKLKLTTEQTDQLGDILADNAVGCIQPVTDVLREGKSHAEINSIFDQRDAEFLDKVQALLGPEGFAEFKDFTRNIASDATAKQFEPQLSGDKDAKQAKSKQLQELMREETRSALAAAGLGSDFQTVPMLNFRNIASEELAETNLKLLDGIYERVAARAASFLSEEELKKFGEFRTAAINQNRMALTVNRKMMAPTP
jgi:hypothetical protein